MEQNHKTGRRADIAFFCFLLCASIPAAFAQASPFETGANSLVDFALTIATPIAVLVVIGFAIVVAVGKISWGWVIGAIVGIAAIFGAPRLCARGERRLAYK